MQGQIETMKPHEGVEPDPELIDRDGSGKLAYHAERYHIARH
jgi:hypothetical protein